MPENWQLPSNCFRDRYELLTRLVEPLRAERDAIVDELWREGADLAAGGRAALLALAGLYARHGRLLRALAEASSQDREAKRAWQEFLEPVIAGHAEKIREEITHGRIAGVQPEPTARALIGMNHQYSRYRPARKRQAVAAEAPADTGAAPPDAAIEDGSAAARLDRRMPANLLGWPQPVRLRRPGGCSPARQPRARLEDAPAHPLAAQVETGPAARRAHAAVGGACAASQTARACGVVGSKSALIRRCRSPRSAQSCALEGRPQNQ